MRFLIIDTYYKNFLENFYQRYPEAIDMNYDEHKKLLISQLFGTSDFYSKTLKKIGHEAEDIIFNDPYLQIKWAKENNLKINADIKDKNYLFRVAFDKKERILSWNILYKILKYQIEYFKPDFLYIHAITYFNPLYLFFLKRKFKVKILGQIASPLPPILYFKPYDLILSSLPNIVAFLNKNKIKAEYLKLAFDPEVLNHLKELKEKYQVVFIGSFSEQHKFFISYLEDVAQKFDLKIWSPSKEEINSNILQKCYMGKAWGKEMYNVLYNSLITINRHSKIAENYANNMRLYEATGVGTMLITDFKDNLNELFEIGKEIECYRNGDELFNKIVFYLKNEEKRKGIAQNGQKRTLTEHTYENRMKELITIINKYF
jgi:glycosyltransferase involved in cell wall biosynthesis